MILEKKTSKIILFLIIVVIFYASILLISDLQKVALEITKINLSYYGIIFPLVILTLLIAALRYHIILRKLNINLSFKYSLLIHTAGSSLSITPGGFGSLIKSQILKEKWNISLSSTFPTIIYERLLDTLSMVTFIGILLFWNDLEESKIVFVIGIIAIIFLFLLFKKNFGMNSLKKIGHRIRFLQKFTSNIDESKETVNMLITPKIFSETLSLSLIIKLITVFIIFLIFKSLDINFDLFLSGQIYYTALLSGALTLIPGGIVVTESSMLGLILKNGVDFSLASLLVLTIRFVMMWFIMIIGFFALKIVFTKN